MPAAAQRHAAVPGADLEGAITDALGALRAVLGKVSRSPECGRAVMELIDIGLRLAELRAAVEVNAAAGFCREQFIELGRSLERASRPAPPSPRRRAGRASQPPLMRVVQH